MEIDNLVLFVFSIGILISSLSTVKGSNLSPFSSIADEVLNEAEEAIGPVSSFDLDKLGPIPSLDEAKQAFGPVSSLDEAKDKAKDALGPISPSTLEEAKSVSSKALDKVEEGFDSIASWISQNKLDVSSYLETVQEEFGPVSSSLDINKAKEVLAPISPSLDEAVPPISPSIVDEAKHAVGPISSETLDEAKEKFGSITSWFSQNKEEMASSILAEEESSPISSTDVDKDEDALDEAKEAIGSFSHKALDEAKEKFGSLSSLISQNKEEISSSFVSAEAKEELGSKAFDGTKGSITQNKGEISSSDEDGLSQAPSPASPSTLYEAKEAIGSISSKALEEAKETVGSITSLFSQNKEEIYFDHDVALAIESLIKQGRSNSQLAIEEAKKLLSVTETVASPDTGTCVKKCMDNYTSCLDSFNKAMEELRARNAELLTNDVSAVEGKIFACQKCFIENKGEQQSSLKDLEEAITKATHECLNVLHHSG